jgi:hypothetical protein
MEPSSTGTGIYLRQKKYLFYRLTYFANRLQVVAAKIQQSLPQRKRDGERILGSLWHSLMFNDSSTSRAGSTLSQAEFIPKLLKSLQESPSEVIADFEEIRKYSKFDCPLLSNSAHFTFLNSHGSLGHQIFSHWKCSEFAQS